MATPLTIYQYAEQRYHDWLNQRDEADDDSYAAARASASAAAFKEILDFTDGHYRPEYLEAVADRSERRRLFGR